MEYETRQVGVFKQTIKTALFARQNLLTQQGIKLTLELHIFVGNRILGVNPVVLGKR